MNTETTTDYFNPGNEDPVELEDREYGAGSLDGPYRARTVTAYVEREVRLLTAEDAAVAIAGILHLFGKPDEDLHGYTRYLEDARAFVNKGVRHVSLHITANPDNGPDFAREYGDCDAAAVEADPRPRSLEEIIGQ